MYKAAMILILNSSLTIAGAQEANDADKGVTYKINLGLFKDSVPADQVSYWESTTGYTVETYSTPKHRSGELLYVYIDCYIGNFMTRREAQEYLDELTAKGFKSMYVEAFKDGKPRPKPNKRTG